MTNQETQIEAEVLKEPPTKVENSNTIVEQSHIIESNLGRQLSGEITNIQLRVISRNPDVTLEFSEEGELQMPTEEVNKLDLEPTEKPPEKLTTLSDIRPEHLSGEVKIDVPIKGDNTHLSVTVTTEAIIEVSSETLLRPIYYSVPLESYTLKEVYNHTYFSDKSSQTDGTATETTGRQKVTFQFLTMDTIRIRKASRGTIVSKVGTKLGDLNTRLRKGLSQGIDGEDIAPNKKLEQVLSMIAMICLIGLMLIGFPLISGLPDSQVPSALVISCVSLLIPFSALVLFTHHTGGYTNVSVWSNSYPSNELNMYPVSSIFSKNKDNDNHIKTTEVTILSENDSVYLQEKDSGKRWKLPETNNNLTQESIRFLRVLGTENIGSDVTVQYTETTANCFSEDESIRVGDRIFAYRENLN